MNSLRRWLYRPKKTDTTLLASFFFADEELNAVAAELDSFDGRKDPERCTTLVNKLRNCQDKVLVIVQKIIDDAVVEQKANRDYRVKFPDDVQQDNLAGQLWFGAECLAAGSSIMNREIESAAMRPLARALTKNLDSLRTLLRDQCLHTINTYTERIKEALVIFDKLFAEFELSYVSAMVPVKTMKEYDLLQEITVLFSETVQRALKEKYITQEMIDDYDPALMFTIPRLAIISGLLVYPEGPLNPDMEPSNMSEMFRPFQTLLQKIRELLYTLSIVELTALEKSLCSADEPDLQRSPSKGGGGIHQTSQTDPGYEEGSDPSGSDVFRVGSVTLHDLGEILQHSPNSGSPVTPVTPEIDLGLSDFPECPSTSQTLENIHMEEHEGSPTDTIMGEGESLNLSLNKSESKDSGLHSENVSTSDTLMCDPCTASGCHDNQVTVEPSVTTSCAEDTVLQEKETQRTRSQNSKPMLCRKGSLQSTSSGTSSTSSCSNGNTDCYKSCCYPEYERDSCEICRSVLDEIIDNVISQSNEKYTYDRQNSGPYNLNFEIPRISAPSAGLEVQGGENSLPLSVEFDRDELYRRNWEACDSPTTDCDNLDRNVIVEDELYNATINSSQDTAAAAAAAAAAGSTSQSVFSDICESCVQATNTSSAGHSNTSAICDSCRKIKNETSSCNNVCTCDQLKLSCAEGECCDSRTADNNTSENSFSYPSGNSRVASPSESGENVNVPRKDCNDSTPQPGPSRTTNLDSPYSSLSLIHTKAPNPKQVKASADRACIDDIHCRTGSQLQDQELPSEDRGDNSRIQRIRYTDSVSSSYTSCASTHNENEWEVSSGADTSETSSYNSECRDDEEIALAIQAAEVASRKEARSRFTSSRDLIHRLFVCIAGVADQLQTNYAGDLRHILKSVFEMNSSEPLSLEIDDKPSTPRIILPGGRRGNMRPRSYRRGHGSRAREPPEWVPDDLATFCTSCKLPFTFVRRRHHCRNCGKIFCGRCSSNSVPLPHYGHTNPTRVCNRCFMFQVTPFTVNE